MPLFRGILDMKTLRTGLAPQALRAPEQPMQWTVSVDFGGAQGHELEGLLACTIEKLRKLGVTQVRYELRQRETLDIATNPNNRPLHIVRTLREAGIDVLAVVGVGNRGAVEDGLDGDDADYLPRIAKNVREITAALTPLGVTRYQLENEVNAAGLGTLPGYHWRNGRKWWKDDFKEEVIRTLAQAVKSVNPDAKVHTNLLDGLSDPSSGVDEMLERLSPYLDEIGFDFYTNQILPFQVTEHIPNPLGKIAKGMLGLSDMTAFLKERVAHYEALSGLPVRISETGYPTEHALFTHDAGGQYRFVQTVTEAAMQSGASAFGYYRLMDPEHVETDFLGSLNPNKGTEPYFGLVNADCEEKVGTVREGLFGPEREVSAFEAFREAVARSRA
jgi:hypothetical protein